MFKLIKNVKVYSPLYAGTKDILICGDKIVKLDTNIDFKEAKVIDKEGLVAIPGIIDQHIHVTGGGGEGGFHTRTSEVMLSNLVTGGITTVVGLLGTDSITRSVEDLVAKTKALKNEGLSAFCLTGAYTYPSPTITGSVQKDIAFIDEIIGLKLAISDHRESFIRDEELRKLVAEVRVSSMVSGKPGIVTFHIGDDAAMLNPLFKLVEQTSLPIHHLRPTHVNRNTVLLEESLSFLKQGGTIDLTVGFNLEKFKQDIDYIQSKNIFLNKVTISSDGNGSWSRYDGDGKLIEMGVSACDGILRAIRYLVKNGYSIEDVLPYGTSNVADALQLGEHKGYLKVGYDADIVLLNADLNIDTVIARGKVMMTDQKVIVKGTYEV